MNASQLVRKARLEVDAIRTGGTVSGLWTDEEVLDAVNTAVDTAYSLLRLADSEIVTKSMRSTDASTDLISETYAPSSLAIASGTSDYTLPPDLVALVALIPVTAGYTDIRFRVAKPYNRYWADQRSILAADFGSVKNEDMAFSMTLIGARTLRIAPTPQDAFDVELIYRFRPARLQIYEVGKIVLSNGGTAVGATGATTWLSSGLRAPAELIIPGPSSTAVLNTYYRTVSSVDNENAMTLSRAYSGTSTDAAGTTYTLAMVPRLPEEHHPWLAQMAAALLLRKVNLELSGQATTALEKQLAQTVQPEFTMRAGHESPPVEPYELP